MATKILIKRNTTNSNAPGTSDLEIGELSLNLYGTNSGTLYTKNADGQIINLTDSVSSGAVLPGAAKSIAFYASTGINVSDTADGTGAGLFWDDANDRVGINTSTPTSTLQITGTDGVVIPVGTTAQRSTATQGKIRYNTTLAQFEGYTGSSWGPFGGGTGGGADPITGNWAKATYRFDQIDDKITVTDNAVMDNVFDGGGTIESWIYPRSDGEGNNGRIVDKGKFMFYVSAESGGNVTLNLISCWSTTNGYWYTGAEIPINDWTHVAVTYNSDATTNDAVLDQQNNFLRSIFYGQ